MTGHEKREVPLNPIHPRDQNTTRTPRGGPIRPPPTISAPGRPIFKKLVSMVSSGGKEHTCEILSKSAPKHGSYGSSKKNGTRDSSRIRDKEQKTQNGPNRKFFFFKINKKIWILQISQKQVSISMQKFSIRIFSSEN